MSISKLSNTLLGLGTRLKAFKETDLFNKVNELVDWVNNNSSNTTASYGVFRARLNQFGTNAPTISVLENTLTESNPTPIYNDTGAYTLSFASGTFPDDDKVFIAPMIAQGGKLFNVIVNDDQEISITSILTLNGELNNTCFEILVYP